MNRIILVCSLLLFSNIINGQENKISIGFLGSFDKYDFDFKSITGFEHAYKMNSAYSFGLGFQYNISENILLKSGLQYSEKGYQLDYEFNFIDPGDPLIPRETKLKTNYLSIPIVLGYYIINGDKIKLSPAFGFVGEFLICNDETSAFGDNSERESEFLNQNLNKVLLSPQLNISFEYHIGEKIFLAMEPYLRYGFSSVYTDIIESNSISYGGIFSINYKLK